MWKNVDNFSMCKKKNISRWFTVTFVAMQLWVLACFRGRAGDWQLNEWWLYHKLVILLQWKTLSLNTTQDLTRLTQIYIVNVCMTCCRVFVDKWLKRELVVTVIQSYHSTPSTSATIVNWHHFLPPGPVSRLAKQVTIKSQYLCSFSIDWI